MYMTTDPSETKQTWRQYLLDLVFFTPKTRCTAKAQAIDDVRFMPVSVRDASVSASVGSTRVYAAMLYMNSRDHT